MAQYFSSAKRKELSMGILHWISFGNKRKIQSLLRGRKTWIICFRRPTLKNYLIGIPWTERKWSKEEFGVWERKKEQKKEKKYG